MNLKMRIMAVGARSAAASIGPRPRVMPMTNMYWINVDRLWHLLLRYQNRANMGISGSPLKLYALSAIAVGLILLVSLGGAIGPLSFAPFLLAVIVSALAGGTG